MGDWGPLMDAVGKLGLFVTASAALWYFILTPRKTHDGKTKSSVLVPGWIHDEAIADEDRVRLFYAEQLKTEQVKNDARIAEWRGFRDEESARLKDTEIQRDSLLKAVGDLSTNVGTLLGISQELMAAIARIDQSIELDIRGRKPNVP